jgi:uncharacterized RDD family membrane protein YckC
LPVVTDPSPAPSTTLPYATASLRRRALALLVDWIACSFVIVIFRGPGATPLVGGFLVDRPDAQAGWWVLLVYLVESVVLTTLAGGSFGKIATRLRTVRTTPVGPQLQPDPRPLDPIRTIARQILIAVVIPPLIFRPDGRGLHDLAAGTATVTLQTYRQIFLRKA